MSAPSTYCICLQLLDIHPAYHYVSLALSTYWSGYGHILRLHLLDVYPTYHYVSLTLSTYCIWTHLLDIYPT